MIPIIEMSQLEIGAYVQSHLSQNGVRVVLSGGASVSYYTNAKYISRDLDMVNLIGVDRKKIKTLMEEIGFIEESRHFSHPDNPAIVEFPPGPLSVGAEPVKRIEEVKLKTGSLMIISATDCVKDRLAAFYHWNDRQCLAQAILLIQTNKIDMNEVRRWSQVEGMMDKFLIVLNEIREK